MNELFMNVRNYIFERFKRMTLITNYPQSSWYIFIDFKHYQNKLNRNNIFTSDDIVSYLINEIGLITLPGRCFGDYKNLTIRYSFIDIIEPENKHLHLMKNKKILIMV